MKDIFSKAASVPCAGLGRRRKSTRQQRRFAVALAIVLMLFAALASVSMIEAALHNQLVSNQVFCDISEERRVSTANILAFAEAAPLIDEIPSEVVNDLRVPSNAREVIVDKQADGGIVSYVSPCRIDEAWLDICDHFKASSWETKEAGRTFQGVFYRAFGICRWVFVSCVEMGNETTVVMQYQLTQGGN